MPELSEVETVCRQIDKHLKGKKIVEVELDDKDRWLFAFAKASEVKRSLFGATMKGTGRKGKYFWIELDRKPWPLLHLGMSGSIAILDPKAKKEKGVWEGAQVYTEYEGRFRDRLWFSRLLVRTKDGKEMAVVDPRRFGRLWLADEILFQARLSPHHLAARLTPEQVRALRKATLSVVKIAVKAGGDYERFPKDWLFHERWGKSKAAKTKRGKIVHETVGGRTTAWVPGWQK